jgi:hypothetical protein
MDSQKIYFWLSVFLGNVNGWSYGLMMGYPQILVQLGYPLVIYTTISFGLWILFGKKFLIFLNQGKRLGAV